MEREVVTRRRARAVLRALLKTAPERRAMVLAALPAPAVRAIAEEWWWGALRGQREPPGDWRIWIVQGGRGFGKTRLGAEWVWARARERGDARIALVGGTIDEAARVMVEGESGLLACARSNEAPLWRRSRGVLSFPSGAEAFVYSGERPDGLRGPQHHFAWCDELAKWRHPLATWDNLMLGLRLGEAPRTIVTTTPRAGPALKALLALARTVRTRGRTRDNPVNPEDFRAAMYETYGGTRLGRQELDGELIEDVAGALWTRATVEACRMGTVTSDCPLAPLARIVVGVDPPASAEGTCGIVVCGIGGDGLLYVLADVSASGLSPNGWAKRVAAAAETWRADRVVAEANNGGNMVAEVLAGVEDALPVKLVNASRGKAARAEPVAMRFEAGKARFAGAFPELEDQLCALTTGGGYQGPGASPDRADAMVWALTELMRPRAEPNVRQL